MAGVALLGGSFNPPHVAHQMSALWVLATGRAELVWLVPCYQHPFGKALAPFEHRVRMCELAVAPFAKEQVAVSRVEEQLDGESRTLFTIRRLVEQHPEHRFSLVIGADILAEKDSWYRFDAIEALVDVVVIGREGYVSPDDAPVMPDVSSTLVRSRIAQGQPVDWLVPAPVLRYIGEHELYVGHDG